jgi:hypothetical protein
MTAMPRARILPAAVLVAALVVGAVQRVPAGEGIEQLEGVVDAACDCAAGHETGLEAVLICTRGPSEFGRLKVVHRDGWGERERRLAAELERVIAHCIANAMSEADARDLLGLPQPASDGPARLARWRRVAPSDLAGHGRSLVRIDRAGGGTVKGLVESFDGATVRLRVARADGGGVRELAVDTIRGAWVMELAPP